MSWKLSGKFAESFSPGNKRVMEAPPEVALLRFFFAKKHPPIIIARTESQIPTEYKGYAQKFTFVDFRCEILSATPKSRRARFGFAANRVSRTYPCIEDETIDFNQIFFRSLAFSLFLLLRSLLLGRVKFIVLIPC